MYQIALLISLSISSFVGFYEFSILFYPWYLALFLSLIETIILAFLIAVGMMYYSFWNIHRQLMAHHEEHK